MNTEDKQPPLAPASCSATVAWPTDEGVWMGNIPKIGWFPLRTKFLLGDLPNDPATFEKPIALVAQWPESATSWPFTFQGCHPVKEWRRPDADELEKARHFYGESPNSVLDRTAPETKERK